MNLAEMSVEVRERSGLLARDQMAQPATLTRLINSALGDIETEQPSGWPWLRIHDLSVTLTDGVGSYPFASLSGFLTWRKVRSVRMTNSITSWPLIRSNITTIETQASEQPVITPGAPTLWATDGFNLVFGPPPNAGFLNVLVDVVIAEGKLVNDLDTPLMPEVFHDVVIEQAVYKLKRRVSDAAGANLALAAVTAGVKSMRGYARAQTGPAHVNTRDDAPF